MNHPGNQDDQLEELDLEFISLSDSKTTRTQSSDMTSKSTSKPMKATSEKKVTTNRNPKTSKTDSTKKQAHSKNSPSKKSAKKKHSENASNVIELRLTAAAFTVLIVCMLVYLMRFTATSEQDMINNSYNSRQQILLSRNYRGSIYSADGEVLAETILDVDENEKRSYPYKKLFSHIVGFSSQGKMGVESLANYYLINSNLALNKRIQNDVAEKKNPGDNVYTTLSVALQKTADQQLSLYRGAIVVTEVKTGKILALVSHPDFDPNEISDIWDELVADKSNSVLLNRATQGLYPPGSTFKILTALEYYRENKDCLKTYRYQCNGVFSKGKDSIHCIHGTHHGSVTFETSFANSCNASFANMGSQLSRSDFSLTLQKMLFGKELPLTLAHSKSSFYLPEDDDPEVEMMQTSIGQGKTQVTPIHMNLITMAIANNGILMKPYVIDHVENADGQMVKQFNPSEYGRLLSKDEAEMLQSLMKSVVQKGNGGFLKGLDYTAAGKTGSAEFSSNKEESHAWFTGYAPAEDPQIAVTVIVERAGTGGTYAIPIAKSIFDVYFHQLAENSSAQ